MEKDKKRIVWLASYPKSGNTWFRVFLNNLLSEKQDQAHINRLHSTTMASSRSLLDEHSGVSSSDLTQEEILELRPLAYRKIAEQADRVLYYKVHDAWMKTPSGKPVFPTDVTRAVLYFVRNPLDIAVSFAFHSGMKPAEMIKRINNEEFAFCAREDRIYHQLMQPLRDWTGHVKSWVDDSGLPVHVIRYEDLLNNPFRAFSDAVSFIGLKKNETEIRDAIKKSSIHTLQEMEQEDGFVEKPLGMRSFFREGKSGNWKQHLTNNQVNTIVNKHVEYMERFGYLQ